MRVLSLLGGKRLGLWVVVVGCAPVARREVRQVMGCGHHTTDAPSDGADLTKSPLKSSFRPTFLGEAPASGGGAPQVHPCLSVSV